MNGIAENEWFGHSVALNANGTIFASGVPFSNNGGIISGGVRVFQFDTNSSSWEPLGAEIVGQVASDSFGYSISISSDGFKVAIGAYLNDGNGTDSGNVRVFEYNTSNNSWQQLGQNIVGEASEDFAGNVGLSGDGSKLAIGATGNDGGGNLSGHVRVFHYNENVSTWQQLGVDIEGEAAMDESGIAVGLNSDGTRVAIGATQNNGGSGSFSGHVRVFQNEPLGIEDESILIPEIVLYPNPVANYFMIENSGDSLLEPISIYDIEGRLVKNYDVLNTNFLETMDVSDLSPALYSVIIRSNKGSIVRKLIKE